MTKPEHDICQKCILNRVCRGELSGGNNALPKLIAFISQMKNNNHVVKSLVPLPNYVLEEEPMPLACDGRITYRRYGPELDYPDVILEAEDCNYFVQTAKNKMTLLLEQDLAQMLDEELQQYEAQLNQKGQNPELLGKVEALREIQAKIASTLPVALCGTGDLIDATDIQRATIHKRSQELGGIKTKYIWIFPFYKSKELAKKLIIKRKKKS